MKHIATYLSHSNLKRQASNDWLMNIWRRTAPPAMREVCHAKKHHNNCLTLQVDSAIWLSRIRQQQNALIRHLRRSREFADLEKIKLEVSPRQTRPNPKNLNHFHQKLSETNKNLLLCSAKLTTDPELSQSLIKLAKTASRS